MKTDPWTVATCCRFPSNSLLLDEFVDQSLEESFQRSHPCLAAGLPDSKVAAGCRSPKRRSMSRLILSLFLLTSFFTAPLLQAQEQKVLDLIQALTPSIVTVTRIEPANGGPANKPVSHAGVVVDSRGYIVIPLLPSSSKPKLFAVRFADQQDVFGELVAIDESLKFGVLKIERPQPVTAVSLAKSREARVDDRVLLVPSSRSKELRGGRVTSTTISLSDEGSTKLIQSDVTFPLMEYGSLMVSEAGDVIGLLMASRDESKVESFALPVKAMLPLIEAAINKSKDVPLVTLPASPPAIDLANPVQVLLQPATAEAKAIIERFADRGAKVLEFEEGGRLKIEAPPMVLEEIGKHFRKMAFEEKADTKPTQPTESAPVASSKMPDITGTWRVEFVSPNIKPSAVPHFEIRRVGQGETDFLIDIPWVKEFRRISVKWSTVWQRFEGEFNDDDTDEDRCKITLQPQADRNSLRVIITARKPSQGKQSNPADTNSDKTEEYVTQIWTRTSMTFATTFPAKEFGLPEAAQPSDSPTGPALIRADRGAGGLAPKDVAPQRSGLPDTPAAKRLVEQLGTQESAAAAEAATIRQLQANGQAEQNRQAIAEHQRKLKNLLSTAFDLKLQLEELQVQELQSRLSRLERQIGQRKELREKIINRRAGELIEGDTLKWDASDINSKKERPDQNVRTSQIRVIDSDGLNRGDGPRCSLSSPPEPIEVLREFERQRGIKQGAVIGIYEKNNQSIGVVVEFIYDRTDPPMAFPLIGRASLHRLRFRCTISFKEVDRSQWPTEAKFDRNGEATIHIDVDHLHRNDREVTAGGAQPGQAEAAGKTSIVVSPSAGPFPSNPSRVAPTDRKAELLAKLQGHWEIQMRSRFPNNESDAVVDRGFAEIKDNLMTSWSESDNKRENPSTIFLKLGEPGPPQQIDLIANPNDGEDRTVMPGLIEVADDVVRICFDPTSNSQRPEVIVVGKQADIWELRRKVKSGDSKPDPLPTPDEPEAKLKPADTVANAQEFTLNKGDHICIVGNTLAERMQHFAWLETLIHARFPEHNLVFRNLGYSGDEIDGWQNPNHRLRSMSFGSHDEWLSGVAPCPQPAKLSKKDLDKVRENRFELTNTKADVIFAFYGYNESFAGEAGLDTFKQNVAAFIKHNQAAIP